MWKENTTKEKLHIGALYPWRDQYRSIRTDWRGKTSGTVIKEDAIEICNLEQAKSIRLDEATNEAYEMLKEAIKNTVSFKTQATKK